MTNPHLFDKDPKRLPNLSLEETEEFERLLDEYMDRILTTAENDIEQNPHPPENPEKTYAIF